MAILVLLLIGLFFGTHGKLNFKYQDCNNSSNKVIHVDSAHLNPYPVQIPGDLTADIIIQAPRLVTENRYKLNISIHKNVIFWIPVPCIANFGSCSYDLCEFFELIKGNVNHCPKQVEDQGLPCTCPFWPGTYTLKPAVFKIPKHTNYLWSLLFTSGDFKVDAKLTDTNTGEEVGCYHVEFTTTEPPRKCSGLGCIFG